ncbi:CD209 antigen-like protein C [Hemiscyllium ocellatum]|uniref:CD209 antigen-like protein C n=1 Tax=Hemiscyllium ocellatum TaxID=170820 RepID=UPI0029662AD4|nr:CD209 antigen-like protein C [Hemiscyllium ocellatum]
MELDNIYTNVENLCHDQLKLDMNQQNLKSEHGVQSTEPVQGKWSPLVICILLGLSILLSMGMLTAAVILFTQLFSNMKMLETDIKMDLTQLLSSVTGLTEKTNRSLDELRNDISQLKMKLPRECPEDWRRFQRNCYYFSLESKNWTEAQRACASLDANLVVINRRWKQAFVKKWLQNKNHWIGLTDSDSEGDWRWVDGTNYTSSVKFWSEGEPNNASDEDCAEIYSNGGWNDRSCDVSQQWICEKP